MGISSGAYLAGALGGSVLGALGSGISNKTAKKIARETNALNYQMFQEANAYNTQMWNAQNEYNLPINQKQRLIDAGVNPAAMIDAPQLGAASGSAPSSVSPPQMQGYQYQNVLGQLGSDMVAETQAMKNISEAKNVDLQNANYEWKLTEEIELMRKQGLLSQAQYDEIVQNMDLKTASWNDLMQQIHANAYLTQKQADIANMQHDILSTYGHVKAEAELDKICAEAYDLIQDGKYKKAAIELGRAGIENERARILIDRFRANFEERESRSRTAVNWESSRGQKLQNDINEEFGRGSAAAKFLIDYYSGKISEPKALKAEWEKIYRSIPPGEIGAILNFIIGDVNPLNGILK